MPPTRPARVSAHDGGASPAPPTPASSVAAAVADRPISVTDFLATVCTVLGIDYRKTTRPPGVDRPIPIVDTSKGVKVLSEVL